MRKLYLALLAMIMVTTVITVVIGLFPCNGYTVHGYGGCGESIFDVKAKQNSELLYSRKAVGLKTSKAVGR